MYMEESQYKGSMDSEVKVEVSGERRRVIRSFDMVLRILGLAFTLVAAVAAGVDKETQIISVTLVDSLPPLHVPVTARWNYMSSSVYFVVSNAIACAYSAASLVLFMLSGSIKKALGLLISDLIIVALLFSANGAAAAVGLIGLNGNSHVQWHKVCNVFETYCHRAAASMVMSMLGSIVFLWLVVLATLDLHKRSSK